MAMTAFPENAAAAGRRQARMMRVVNVPMRAVLRLPFPTPLSANLMLVSYTGVKSGKAYLQPVSYARDGDTLLTPGGGRWTLNLKGGRPVTLRLRGRRVPAHADLVGDPAEVERLLGVIAAGNPRAMRFIPLPRRADGRLEPGRARRRDRPRLPHRPLAPGRPVLSDRRARSLCVWRWAGYRRPNATRLCPGLAGTPYYYEL